MNIKLDSGNDNADRQCANGNGTANGESEQNNAAN